MQCFKHTDVAAVGLCKSCYKAVCKSCAIELEHGLACSEECEIDVDEYNQMNERAKKIYGIGNRKSKIPSTGVILWLLLSSVMWVLFLAPFIMKGKLVYANLALAALFTVIAGIAYYSSKRTGLQC